MIANFSTMRIYVTDGNGNILAEWSETTAPRQIASTAAASMNVPDFDALLRDLNGGVDPIRWARLLSNLEAARRRPEAIVLRPQVTEHRSQRLAAPRARRRGPRRSRALLGRAHPLNRQA